MSDGESDIPLLTGTFTSPVSENGDRQTFGSRALNNEREVYDAHIEITVLKPLPFGSDNSDVIEWFGQQGGGRQSNWNIPTFEGSRYPMSWNELAQQGYIKIEFLESPSGAMDLD